MPGSSPAGVTLAIVQRQYSRLWLCRWGFDSPWLPPWSRARTASAGSSRTAHGNGWVCLAARAADCKSVTRETTQVRVLPHPLMFACPSGLWCCLRSAPVGAKRSSTGASAPSRKRFAPVVQRIEYSATNRKIQVRFLFGVLPVWFRGERVSNLIRLLPCFFDGDYSLIRHMSSIHSLRLMAESHSSGMESYP